MRACATSDTDNNTLYTINTLHDKRAPHATATYILYIYIYIIIISFGLADYKYLLDFVFCSTILYFAPRFCILLHDFVSCSTILQFAPRFCILLHDLYFAPRFCILLYDFTICSTILQPICRIHVPHLRALIGGHAVPTTRHVRRSHRGGGGGVPSVGRSTIWIERSLPRQIRHRRNNR